MAYRLRRFLLLIMGLMAVVILVSVKYKWTQTQTKIVTTNRPTSKLKKVLATTSFTSKNQLTSILNLKTTKKKPPHIAHEVLKSTVAFSVNTRHKKGGDSNLKVILAWTGIMGRPNWGFSKRPRVSFEKMGCAETNCAVTTDRSQLKKADALLFHAHEIADHPPYKLPHQRWIFLSHESPCDGNHRYMSKDMNHMWNWTITYRRDSDIPMIYAKWCKRKTKTNRNYTEILKTKKKSVAWMVSNCNPESKRQYWVNEMKKYIDIDIYGACGTKQCPRHRYTQCLKMISETYKFYLSFENRFSPGYVTEKLSNWLPLDIIPVVRGGANYTISSPPHSVINTNDFKTPKDLANYLKSLEKDDEKYLSYFKWKNEYHLNCPGWGEGWCGICERLHNPKGMRTHYERLSDWWSPKQCWKPSDLGWMKHK